jgi:hypothetical protein
MALWELEELQPPAVLGFIRNLLPLPTYRGNSFLPQVTVDDVEFEYIKGFNDLPVMAHIVTWDAESPMGSRAAQGQRVQGELPPMKRKERITEKEILRFLQPRRGTADQQAAIRQVYARFDRLTASILARIEWLQMQALSEDKVIYSEGGIIIAFDFGITGEQQINLVTQTDGTTASVASKYGPVWTDRANSTPISDLMVLCGEVQDRTGSRPARMVMSRSMAANLLFSEEIKGFAYQLNMPDRPLTQAEVTDVFSRYDLPSISTYDVKVKAEAHDGTTTEVRTMAENKAFLLPAQNIGNTLVGPTAESRLLIGTPYQNLISGIWGNTYQKDEPPSEWTKVAAVAFPSMPNVHELAQMTLGA